MNLNAVFSNKKLIYWFVFAITTIVLLYPVGLPITTLPSSVNSYDIIEGLPDGSVVALTTDLTLGTWPRLGALSIAVTKHVMSRDLKFFTFTQSDEGEMLTHTLMSAINTRNEIYGVDYANFGYVPGAEAAVASIAANVHETLVTDIYGTPISELPIMEDIKDANDVDLLIVVIGSSSYVYYVNQWNAPYGVNSIALTGASYLPQVKNFAETGLFDGWVFDLRGAADYEYLSKNPGDAIKLMDVQSILHIILLSFIVIGNVKFFMERGKTK